MKKPAVSSEGKGPLAGPGYSGAGRPRFTSVAEAFSWVANRYPDATAVRQHGQPNVTYAELDRRSRGLALRLAEQGIGPGHRVALGSSRSLASLVAILGIVRAGAAYVPLDPVYPDARLSFMLSDAGPSIVLADAMMQARLNTGALAGKQGEKLPIWALEDLLSAPLPAELPEDLAAPSAGDDPLYVMYTSGTTGQPKGVVVPHRGVCRLVIGQDYCSLQPDDVILHLAPLAFDASTFEIWGALLNGGGLAIVGDDRPSTDDVAAALRDMGVTTAWLTAGLFHLMVDTQLEALSGLRQLLAGGDVLSPDHVRRFLAAAPQCRLINGYGPTENTTFTCCSTLSDGPWPSASAPIGRAISGTEVFIVDEDLQPVDGMEEGQLVAAGEGLAIGYLGRDDLTREKFVEAPEPISQRVYLTGDLARYLPDGQIEFLGRIDRQVKIDGKRIEPGEIEQVLRGCEGVNDAAVVVETTRSGIKRLLGFLAVGPLGPEDTARVCSAAQGLVHDTLPEFLWPSRILATASLPITPNGKVDHAALLALGDAKKARKTAPAAELEEQISAIWSKVLGLDGIGLDEAFFDLGGGSLQLMQIHAELQKLLGRKIAITGMFARPTIRRLAAWLEGGDLGPDADQGACRRQNAGGDSGAIAIVGLTGRFPGARSIEEFWENQKAGKVSISHFSDEELKDWFDAETRADPNFVRARGVLDDPGMFDADLFGMYPREAELTDPQHRMFLEVSLEALEKAGIDPKRFPGAVGVFAGASMPTYLLSSVLDGREAAMTFASNYQLDGMQTLVGSLPDALATRVAYKLDLHGPAITVLSACSTSAVAVVQACQSLMQHSCDAALAGGVSITFPQQRGYLYQDGGMGSRDGTCRPLDVDASGTVFGSGAAVVVLKRLEDALADGNTIYAVIRGFGINNDGGSKIGFTAPSADGQASAISAALANAHVDPASIGYVELHGTATPLGDPIEFEGLKQAFGPDCAPGGCALGSAKANIGHLDVAAGVTGLIKAALCLHEREIPPLANYKAPNPLIDFAETPFRVEQELAAWPRTDQPRRAGVSSFGVGGTNVHLVLEEAPEAIRNDPPPGLQVLPLSAKTAAALDAQALALADHLESHPDLPMADVAFTLAEGRSARGERAAVVAETTQEAVAKLRTLPKRGIKGKAHDAPPVVFMFPGQGSQYPGMGANLYRTEPVYREWIDRGADLLGTRLGPDLRALLFDLPAGDDDQPHPIRSTVNAQPALFITQHALAQLWMARGVRPSAMIGHSVGEFVAACLAGVMSFADALSLVARRAELMQSAAPGAMLAVRTSEQELAPFLGPDLDIAAINAPGLCVAAGPFAAMDGLEERLGKAGIDCRRLHTSHAFHSAMMDPVVEELEKLAQTITYADPTIPYVSCVTGDWVEGSSAVGGAYWARHCRAPVRFGEALATLVRDSAPMLIEVGPGRALTTFAAQGLEKGSYLAATTSMPEFVEADRDLQVFHEAGARAWTLGAEPDWRPLYGPDARIVPLPAYQFQRKLHWIEPQPRVEAAAPANFPTATASAPPVPFQESNAIDMTAQPTASSQAESRIPRLCGELAGILEELSGETIDASDWDALFLELGFDSLFLGQVATKVQRQFGVKVTFRQLMADFPSIDALARYLDEEMPAEAVAAPAPQPAPAPVETAPMPGAAMTAGAAPVQSPASMPAMPSGGLAETFQMQLAAMQSVIDRQLEVMRGQSPVAMPPAAPAGGQAPAEAPAPAQAAAPTAPPAVVAPLAGASATPANGAKESQPEAQGRFRAFNPKTAQTDPGLSEKQQKFIADLTRRYCDKMPSSKAQTQAHRSYFADPRSVSGFRPEWKEMVFPVVSARSKGSKIWDVDGNEFVDIVNGYGQTAFGHAPDFVQEAVARQLQDGFAIGPQCPLAGEVAQQVSRMVGLERVTFCNTGSEAVMAAMRLARCVTGREKIVVFNNDYHGQFDEVLVKSGGKASFSRAFPLAPGIPSDSVSNMVVLPYGTPEALDWIRANTDDIAAVIVEPVQSRHPELLPFEFLRELRKITLAAEVALVFDEVVTGFRTHPGGMQAVLGIRADMATYGKVVGGGMPVGILAGSSQFMDALDGGMWQFGDQSFPEVAPTFFAGTFVRHPLVIAACKAVLDHIEAEGPQLQENLAARTSGLVSRINGLFAEKGVPSEVNTYSSWFMLDMANAHKLGPLFYYHMRLQGVHVIEGYPCFLTTAHSDADLDRIFDATAETIEALQSADILLPEDGVVRQSPKPPATGPREVPLTEPQLEILLSAQMSPEASCAYNESITLEFDGAIDPATLSEAVQDFIARHDAMRGTVKRGEPVLVLQPSLRIDLPVLSGDEATLAQVKREEAETPFDLVNGPLLRGRIVQMDSGRSALVFTAHHIVFDGWTANIFAEEVAAFYRARKSGTEPQLDPVESFADYALARAGARERESEDMEWWREQYTTLPTPLALPGDRPRPKVKTFKGATITETIDAELMQAVRKAGAKLGCTLFATLFGALQTVIGRLADQEDIVLGCPMAGQMQVEDKVLAGHCVNFLPIRVPMRMTSSLGEHLQMVKQTLLSAFDRQDITYGSLIRSLNIPRDPNRTPLTDVQFNLERLGEDIDFGEASASLAPNAKAAVNFDLFFNMVESGKGLRLDVDYSTELFDESTVSRWIENLRQVLREIVADAGTPIVEVELLGDAERRWLEERNPVLPRLSADTTLPACFAAAAAEHGKRPAILWDGGQRTYAELEERSNRLAHVLAGHGIGEGDLVGLLATRSPATLEVILGILKAGAAYVPLDPAYPQARLDYMIRDASLRLVLVGPDGEAVADALSSDTGMLNFDALFSAASDAPATPVARAVTADDPAYVMYTSGSTGEPKGVAVPHRAVVRLVTDQDFIAFGSDQVFLHLAPLAFDASTLEIWGALLHGGALAVVSEIKPSLGDIARAIKTHGVTTAWFTAALFHALVDEGIEALAPLRQILAGGDVLSPAHVRKVQQALPDTQIVNGYGPTENTTFSACYRFPAEGWGEGSAPIGMPIARTSAYVADARMQLRPQGAVGELLVGGEGLALGYLGKPELTAERFVDNPFVPGERVYRTGDLVRWRSDGALEFVGRVDTQVKINGQRIELGEIESVLRHEPRIRDAAVVVSEREGTRQLHAFLVREPGMETEAHLIEAANALVQRELPRHMHPRTTQVLAALPRTDNGKIDRAELLQQLDERPHRLDPPGDAPVAAALSDTESRIAAIWCDVLGLADVGRDDAIFDLGADSLQIFRIGARMSEQGMDFENRRLLTNPTLSEVAAMVGGDESAPAVAATDVLPLSAYRRGAMRRAEV